MQTDCDPQMSETELRREMAEEFAKPIPDAYRLASLANQLIDLDATAVRFTVDATHVQRLGRELVSKQETALAELIKNAYDADSTVVLINITHPTISEPGKLVIQDDGLGMDLSDIRNGWMRISTDYKVDAAVSGKYARLRAGKKGIGRFAVERLGRRLELTTSKPGEAMGWKITFDWDERFTRGQELGLLRHKVESFDKDLADHGTTLSICGLRDAWDERSLRAAWKAIFLLQSPVENTVTPHSSVADIDSPTGKDPGFQVFIDMQSAEGARVALSLEEEFSKLAIAEIHGSLAQDGTVTYHVDSAKLNFHDSYTETKPELAGLGAVTLTSFYLMYDNTSMPGIKLREAQNLARELGGIKVYRNGFRVSPFGEEGDDWLSLARDSARRVVLIPANNNNFVGRVNVTSKNNPLLEETASREGLLTNAAYKQLVRFTKDCLIWGAKRIGTIRNKKVTAGQRDFTSRPTLHSRIAALAARITASSTEYEIKQALKEILQLTEEYETQTEAEKEQSLKYEAMLRILASLGLSVSVFSHEVSGSTSLLNASIGNLSELIDALAEHEKRVLVADLRQIKISSTRVSDLGGYLGSLTTRRESREMRTLVVQTILEAFFRQFADYADKIGILLKLDPIDPALRTGSMHRSELDSVLFNFLSNSIKAVKRAHPSLPCIRISAVKERKHVLLRFQDNGDGIPPNDRERVFDAFFTTTGYEEDDVGGSGTGLGLRIVSDIANSYGGTVSLGEPDSGMVTAFEFRIPVFNPARDVL